MSIKDPILKYLFFVSLALIVWSCEPSEEGCLDILSSNYGFQAVNECDSCCVYPNLNLSFTLVNDTFAFSLDDTIVVQKDDSILINNINLVLSQFELTGNQNSYHILDSLFINDEIVRDDYAYLELPNTLYNLGDIRLEDTIAFIKMILGFNESDLNSYMPFSQINSDSQLDLALDSLYNENTGEYYFGSMAFEINGQDYQIELINNQQELLYEIDEFVSAGTALELSFSLDVNILLSNINADLTIDEINDVLQANFVNAISIL